MTFDRCSETAATVERYILDHLFDDRGLMYSGIDSHTGRPFDRDFITPRKVPRRAAFDPWSYWTYEDSVMSMGLYLDALILKHEVTGDSEALRRADRIWTIIERVYSASQVHGIGSFLRPYGGFEHMHRFMEPLGTDQASPLFCGLYRYLSHVEKRGDADRAEDIRRVMLNTLTWYEQQGFKYFYYKAFIHGSMHSTCHSNSYYLPAVAWAAATFPDHPRWASYLQLRLDLYRRGDARLYPRKGHPTFSWGSDLDVLQRILGADFAEVFGTPLLEEAYETVVETVGEYEQPGFFKRVCPESADSSFEVCVREPDPENDPEWRTLMAFDYMYTRHHGRTRPRHEVHFLLALAAVGFRPNEVSGLAAELLAARSRVPADFAAFVAEDYERLPETVHLYARSVGATMVGWWRDYWLLRRVTEDA